jgi:hypothetical protein
MKSETIAKTPARAVAPVAPSDTLAPSTTRDAASSADAVADAVALVLETLRGKQKPARETILSRWGDYAKSGLVAATDRGTLLDGKKVGDLLKAAAKAEDRKLETVCADFILRHNAIDKLVKAIEGKAF